MANKKISELTSRTPALSDLMLVGDPSSGYSYKCTVTALATIIETDIADGFVTIGTTQTISGAKTFSNNLTLTSVANATTTQTKFLTLNASNVVNYRTGAEVLADIGGASSSSVSGTTNYIAKFTSSSAIGNSTIQDNGSLVTIGSNTTINTNAPELTLNQGTSSVSIINFKENNSSVNRITSSGAALYFTTNNSATTSLILSSAGTAVFGTIPNATIDTDKFLVSDSGVLKYRTGAEVLSDIGGASAALYVPYTGATTNVNLGTRTITANGVYSIEGTYVANTYGLYGRNAANNAYNLLVGITGQDKVYIDANASGTIIGGALTLSVINNATVDTDTFLVADSGVIKYRTGSQLLSDIGGQAALTNPVTGTGTTNYIPKFTGTSTIGNSAITDNGSITTSLQDFYVTKGNALASITSTNTGGFAVLRFQSSTISDLWFGRESSTSSIFGLTPSSSVIYSEGAYPFITFVNGSERMRLDASGNLGINNSSPSYKLDVTGSGRFTGNLGINGVGPTYPLYVRTGTNQRFRIVDGGSGYTQLASLDDAESAYTPIMIGNSWVNINASGNLGLGVSPSAWDATLSKAIQLNGGSLWGYSTSQINLLQNAFYNSSGDIAYVNSASASGYRQISGVHSWHIAPSGTAGNAISFTQAMTLDASGRLGIGTTSPNSVLEVAGTSATTDFRISRTVSSSTYFYIIAPGGSPSTSIIGINGTDVMTLNASGNVGIGTASPSTRLHIVSGQSSIPDLYIQGAGSSQGWLGFGTTNDYGIQGGADYLAMNFRLNGAERMRITSGGRVGIGQTAPGTALSVAGQTESWQLALTSVTGTAGAIIGSPSANVLAFGDWGGTERMRITSGGNVGIGTTSPNSFVEMSKSSNSGSGGTFPRLAIKNTLATQGDGSATFNFADINISSGNEAVNMFITTTYASGTWSPAGIINVATNHDLQIKTNNTERMRITSGGELLINTTSDAGDYKLQVNGNSYLNANNGALSNNILVVKGGGVSGAYGFRVEANNGDMIFQTNNYTYNSEFGGSIKTAAPSGGTAKPIKFGEAGVTLGGSNTSGVRVEIDGVVYYLVTGYLP